jgi:hypothetical protein
LSTCDSSRPRKSSTTEFFIDIVIRKRDEGKNVHQNGKVSMASQPARNSTTGEKHRAISNDPVGQRRGSYERSLVVENLPTLGRVSRLLVEIFQR